MWIKQRVTIIIANVRPLYKRMHESQEASLKDDQVLGIQVFAGIFAGIGLGIFKLSLRMHRVRVQ